MDDQMADKFEDITRTILSNQTEALANLTKKVEKEIGQVWRQMGIMYGQGILIYYVWFHLHLRMKIWILSKPKTLKQSFYQITQKNLWVRASLMEEYFWAFT